jgi:hypothetical protein
MDLEKSSQKKPNVNSNSVSFEELLNELSAENTNSLATGTWLQDLSLVQVWCNDTIISRLTANRF